MKPEPMILYLEDARRLLAGDGSVSIRSLRGMLRKHGLPVLLIGNRHAVTKATLHELVERCQEPRNPPVSGFDAVRADRQSGSSSTAANRCPPDALKQIAKGLKRGSRSS